MSSNTASQVRGRRAWTPFLVLLTSLLLSLVAIYWAARLFRTRDQLQLAVGIQQTRDAVVRRLGIYTDMLAVGAALCEANPDITNEEFRRYVSALRVNDRYPGIQGIGFSLRVLSEHKEELVQTMERQGLTGFRIWPETSGAECQSIIYLHPMDLRNERAIGYDMSSDPVRKAAMDQARDSAVPAASGRVILVQEFGPQVQPGFLIYAPVYRGGKIPPTVEERRRDLLGFVYSPFRARDLLDGILGREGELPVDFRVFDGPERTQEHLLYQTPTSSRYTRFRDARGLTIAGRQWTLDFAPGVRMSATSASVVIPFMALGGLVISLILFRLTAEQASAYAALEKGTDALKASQADLAVSEELHRMVTDGAADAIISTDDQGLICSVNPATLEIFGYDADELQGKALDVLIPEFQLHRQALPPPVGVRQDLELAAFHKSGGTIPVEISLSGYLRGGRQFHTAVVRNITHRRQAEAVQKRQADLMALRADVSAALAGAGVSIPDALRNCADALARRLGVEFSGVWTVEGTSSKLELRASAGPRADAGREQSDAPLAQPLAAWIADESRPIISNDLAADAPAMAAWAREEKFTSFAGCRLTAENEVIGVVALLGRQPLASDTLEMLSPVAEMIAQGIVRKRIERTLEENEDRLRVALDSAEAGTWEIFPETWELRWSARTKALFGLSEESQLGYEEFLARIYPDDSASVIRAIEAALDPTGEGRYEIDFRSLWPNGAVRWISAKGRAFFEKRGGERRAVRFTGTALDVTKRKHAEETSQFLAEAGSILSESLNHQATLAKLVGLAVPLVADWCAVDMVDSGEKIERLEFVPKGSAETGLAKEARKGSYLDPNLAWGIANVMRSGKSEHYPTVADSSLTGGIQEPEHLRLLRVAGVKSAVIVPIKARGRVFGTFSFAFADSGRTYSVDDLSVAEGLAQRAGLAVDNALLYKAAQQEIAERRRVEEQIHHLNQELEQRVRRRTHDLQETNEQLEAFTYTVAHDLRAPLRAMQGFSQALVEDYARQLDAPGRDYVNRVASAAQRMDSLIQDLLAYSRLSRAQLSLEAVDLEAVVDRTLYTFAQEIRAKQAVIHVERPLPKILAHASTLEHVVGNLVSNALKFVPRGVEPRIRLWAEQRGAFVCFAVSDNGIGIDSEYQERIFRVFERLHGSETFPGTGIGLAIVRKGVERMGGRVGVESRPDQGSKFWIELPCLEQGRAGDPNGPLS